MTSLVDMTVHLVLLVAASAAHHISATPPRIAKESSDHLLHSNALDARKKKQTDSSKEALHGHRRFNCFGMMCVAATKYVVWAITALELTARLLSLVPSSSLSHAVLPIILPTPAPGVSILVVPPPARPQKLLLGPPSLIFLLSVLSISIGFAIRRQCFTAMGRHFSFTHTTLEGHQLVKSGPYSIVRHPSYTGEVFVRGGMALLLLAPGGFVRACGALQQHPAALFGSLEFPQQVLIASVQVGVAFYIAWVSFATTYLIMRAPHEDATLRETFGTQWDAYAKEVPYRFIPYIA